MGDSIFRQQRTGVVLSLKSGTGDSVIRAALHRKKLRRAITHEGALVVEELGLAHARSRIDVAVVNGCVHGYEIKSELDSLRRLRTQLDTYRRALGRLTFVCAKNHLQEIMEITPDWSGVIEANRGPRGAINFTTHRRSRHNPELDKKTLAHLLWRSEAMQLLYPQGVLPSQSRKPRAELYAEIAESMSAAEITAAVKEFMPLRREWKGRLVQP